MVRTSLIFAVSPESLGSIAAPVTSNDSISEARKSFKSLIGSPLASKAVETPTQDVNHSDGGGTTLRQFVHEARSLERKPTMIVRLKTNIAVEGKNLHCKPNVAQEKSGKNLGWYLLILNRF